MKFGLCAWSFTAASAKAGRSPDPMTPEGLLELAVGADLGAIEGAARWFDDWSPATRAGFRERLAEEGLELVLDTGGESPEEIRTSLESALSTAAELGAKVVRTTLSRCLEGDRRRFGFEGWKEHLAALVAPLRAAGDLAASLGLSVGIENHQDICSWELVWLCEQVERPALGVVMDCGNALAVGEHPAAFAERVMAYLKHVHLKDYVLHPSPSGWRFVRCPVGSGVVDFADLVARFDAGAPGLLGCIELGASSARHVQLLEDWWWETFEQRPWAESLAAIRELHRAELQAGLDWRTPHEREEPPDVVVDYELDQFSASVAFLETLTPKRKEHAATG